VSTLTDVDAYAAALREAIDAQRYAPLIVSLGKQLNRRQDRFDKSDFIEQGVEEFSNGRLEWVDEQGRDFRDTNHGYDIEFKYETDLLFTPARKQESSSIKPKIKNSLGTNKGTNIPDKAEFYMFGQQDALAITTGEILEEYLVSVPDGIEAHLDFDALSFVFRPSDVGDVEPVDINYKDEKMQMQRRILRSI